MGFQANFSRIVDAELYHVIVNRTYMATVWQRVRQVAFPHHESCRRAWDIVHGEDAVAGDMVWIE
jgi:hypothetical protein